MHIMTVFKKIISIFIVILFVSANAHAGFKEGYRALNVKDYPTAVAEARKGVEADDVLSTYLLAFLLSNGYGIQRDLEQAYKWYQKAAEDGVKVAYAKLAWANFNGAGVPKDVKKAYAYANIASVNNDPEGAYLIYLIIHNEKMNYLDINGKIDRIKYQQLAERPITTRQFDTKALDSLYASAKLNYVPAKSLLAIHFGSILGDDNRQKMTQLIKALPVLGDTLQTFQKISQRMDALGKSYATPKLFSEAQFSTAIVAASKACGSDREAVKNNPPKLVATTISERLSDAVYLPSHLHRYRHAMLISGVWKEKWTYTVCGKTVPVTVEFVADGLGSAQFSSKL